MTKANKSALIVGVTGQDGAYLSELLLQKGYVVHGLRRRASLFNTNRIDSLLEREPDRLQLHYGDLVDASNLTRIIQEVKPDEIYNLGAQSHVHISFTMPEYTGNVTALGATRLLESLRILGLIEKTRFYQASTSELFGKVAEIPQTELTPFHPRSPYAISKLYAYWATVNYREAYNLHASNGILFNHESPLRGETFVTRKITRAVSRISLGLDTSLHIGNLDAKRDWGHAKEYVHGMWLMLQQDSPDDYVLATGITTSIRDFVKMAFACVDMDVEFHGKGLEEVGICKKSERVLVTVDPKYFRATEVDILLGDARKAETKLGWKAKITVEELCREMVEADLQRERALHGIGRAAPRSVSHTSLGLDF